MMAVLSVTGAIEIFHLKSPICTLPRNANVDYTVAEASLAGGALLTAFGLASRTQLRSGRRRRRRRAR